MDKVPPRLPAPLDEVVVPQYFHPSSFVQLERCALSVMGRPGAGDERESALLLPHPTAYLGLVLHHVRQDIIEGRWGEANEPVAAVRSALAAALADVEAVLSRHPRTSGIVPLRESVGRRAWRNRTKELERWAIRADVEETSEAHRPLVFNKGSGSSPEHPETQAKIGAEKTVQDEALRMRGRPDWSEKTSARLLEVVDYKTGRLFDVDDRLLEDHVIQVQLYALMLENAFPGAEVLPYVEGFERVKVPWETSDRNKVLARLFEVLNRYPMDVKVSADEIGQPGVHCRGCRLRPMCPSYLGKAPAWWKDDGVSPRPLPLDTWGVVKRKEGTPKSQTVWIADEANRRVRVDGFRAGAQGIDILVNDRIWFFDLEASEDTNQHGAQIHPRNFHEMPPGNRWPTGKRVRVFRC